MVMTPTLKCHLPLFVFLRRISISIMLPAKNWAQYCPVLRHAWCWFSKINLVHWLRKAGFWEDSFNWWNCWRARKKCLQVFQAHVCLGVVNCPTRWSLSFIFEIISGPKYFVADEFMEIIATYFPETKLESNSSILESGSFPYKLRYIGIRARWEWYWTIQNHKHVSRQFYSYKKFPTFFFLF